MSKVLADNKIGIFDADANGEVKDDSALNDLNKEMWEADIIGFNVKQG